MYVKPAYAASEAAAFAFASAPSSSARERPVRQHGLALVPAGTAAALRRLKILTAVAAIVAVLALALAAYAMASPKDAPGSTTSSSTAFLTRDEYEALLAVANGTRLMAVEEKTAALRLELASLREAAAALQLQKDHLQHNSSVLGMHLAKLNATTVTQLSMLSALETKLRHALEGAIDAVTAAKGAWPLLRALQEDVEQTGHSSLVAGLGPRVSAI
jgi:hypothetical protein